MLRFFTAGESHGPALMAILDGIPAGLPLDAAVINRELKRRQKGFGAGERMQIEDDRVQILAGVMGGKTFGAPIGMLIPNLDHENWAAKEINPMTIPRPGHADLTGAIKYGLRDLRPALERASARVTASTVAVGAICKHFLTQFGIQVLGYVTSIGTVDADVKEMTPEERFVLSEGSDLRCPDANAANRMREEINNARKTHETLGGILEIAAVNVPPGLGSYTQWDRRLNARLASAVLSIQAMKGVEIGSAFDNTRLQGTQAQDGIRLADGALVRTSNHAGGIEGGISNGQPIIIRVGMKPIATTLTPHDSVDLSHGDETRSQYERSDICPVPRAVPILEAMVAFVLADELISSLGGDDIAEMLARFAALRQARLEDLHMEDHPHTWWPL
jgi:chorismate synthase